MSKRLWRGRSGGRGGSRGGWHQDVVVPDPVAVERLELRYRDALQVAEEQWADAADAAAALYLATGAAELTAGAETLTLRRPTGPVFLPRPARRSAHRIQVELTSRRRGCTDIIALDPDPAAIARELVEQVALAEALATAD